MNNNITKRIKKLGIKQTLTLLREQEPSTLGQILLRLNKYLQKELLNKLKSNEIIKILHFLDPDEVTDLLQRLSKRRQRNILKKLNIGLKNKVEFLLRFDPKSAGGLMNLDYILINKRCRIADVTKLIHKHEKRTGKVPIVLVVDNSKLLGELPIDKLISGKIKKNQRVISFIKKIATIRYDADINKIIDRFKKHPHNKIIVLDKDGSVIGIIYSDDVLRVIDRKGIKSLYNFAAVSEEEDVNDKFMLKVRGRYKWLIINLFTAFLAAGVVGLFKSTIQRFVIAAMFMPVIAGMGGNAATQTMAVMVRGLSLGEVDKKLLFKVIINEVIAGFINGLIIGIVASLVTIILNKSYLFGVVITIAMTSNLIIAAFVGTIIPIIMKSLNKDPATSASIFITTITDICGFFVLLGLTSLIV